MITGTLISVLIWSIISITISAGGGAALHARDGGGGTHPHMRPPEFCSPSISNLPHSVAMHLRDLIQQRQIQARIIRDLENLVGHKSKVSEVRDTEIEGINQRVRKHSGKENGLRLYTRERERTS